MSPAAGSSARRAGHDWERALSRRWGVPTTRNTRPGVHDDGGDLLLPGWYVEAKNTATWRVAPWFHLAEQNATPNQAIALVLKRRHMAEGDALVVITLDTYDRLRGGIGVTPRLDINEAPEWEQIDSITRRGGS